MQLTFWGVRGSFPVARPHVREYGGNTSCIHLSAEDAHLIIDAGTGIRNLGEYLEANELAKKKPVHLLISHTHWDHIQGFPFFAPAYRPDYELHFYSVVRSRNSLASLLSQQQDQNFFPVQLEHMRARLEFHTLNDGQSVQLGPFRVTTRRLNHPGVSSGFRVEYQQAVFAYVSDVSPAEILVAEQLEGSEQEMLDHLDRNQYRLAEGADMVVYDTMFTPAEYAERKHWGHSTPEHGIEVCQRCEAGSLFLFHHNPDTSDRELTTQVEGYRDRLKGHKLQLNAAQEGTCWTIKPGEVEPCG